MEKALETALVTAVLRERYELRLNGALCYARLKQSVYQSGTEEWPTVGDWVEIQPNPAGDGVICKTAPRRTFFARLDPDKSRLRQQAVAANFDEVWILASLNRDLNLRRIERYLTLSWESGAVPLVVLTKADLSEDADGTARGVQAVSPGVEVRTVSALTGAGLPELAERLRPGRTTVLLGSSGVGKSSLVNALAGEERMAAGEIRADDDRGRHTTTHRQLVTLPDGGMLIDTPGMRELGMWGVDAGLGETFADVEAYLGGCKFSDCRHEGEPGCAVAAAIEAGDLTSERLESYRKLLREAQYIENRAAYLRDRTARFKGHQKELKQRRREHGE